MSQVLKKMQFRQNRNELLNLDDDTLDDDVSWLGSNCINECAILAMHLLSSHLIFVRSG